MEYAQKTPDQVKAWLDRHGVSVSEWSRLHGFAPATVYAVLSGRCTGRRGQAHRVAVALGIKVAADSSEPSPLGDYDPTTFDGRQVASSQDLAPSGTRRYTMR